MQGSPEGRRPYTRADTYPHEGSDVMVTCWCERSFGHVPLEHVRAGLTFSCGPTCNNLDTT